jgi:hypothetical protein
MSADVVDQPLGAPAVDLCAIDWKSRRGQANMLANAWFSPQA